MYVIRKLKLKLKMQKFISKLKEKLKLKNQTNKLLNIMTKNN